MRLSSKIEVDQGQNRHLILALFTCVTCLKLRYIDLMHQRTKASHVHEEGLANRKKFFFSKQEKVFAAV
jgi:hypothetical protein